MGAPPSLAAPQSTLQSSQSVNSTTHQAAASMTAGASAPNPYPTTPGETYDDNYDLVVSTKPGKTVTTKGTSTLTLGAATTFNGYPAFQYTAVLNYTKTNGATGTTTTNNYRNFVGNYFYQYGDTTNGTETLNGVTTTSSSTETYASPFILDILPEKNGNKVTEPYAYTVDSTTSSTSNGSTNTTTSTFTRNADGSSTDSESIQRGGNTYSYSYTINSDYSATVTNTQPGQPTSGTTTFSAPSGGIVTVTYTPLSGQPQTTSVPVWWGTTPLYSDELREIASNEPVPPRCKSKYDGQSSANLREFISGVDPVTGTVNSEVEDKFVVSGVGVVCNTETRTVTTYANRSTGSETAKTSYSLARGTQTYTP